MTQPEIPQAPRSLVAKLPAASAEHRAIGTMFRFPSAFPNCAASRCACRGYERSQPPAPIGLLQGGTQNSV